MSVSLGALNGGVRGISGNGTIGAIVVSPTVSITFGASYSPNMAAADTVSEVITDLDGDGEWDLGVKQCSTHMLCKVRKTAGSTWDIHRISEAGSHCMILATSVLLGEDAHCH